MQTQVIRKGGTFKREIYALTLDNRERAMFLL